MEDDYYFQIDDESKDDRLFVLIIYDIVNNSRRTKFAKLLLGYGFRIQKSAFEAVITKSKLMKLNHEIPSYINEKEDCGYAKEKNKRKHFSPSCDGTPVRSNVRGRDDYLCR